MPPPAPNTITLSIDGREVQAPENAMLADAAKLGDYLRYSMFDKYFKQISANCSQQGSVACPAGTSKANEDTYLLSWFDAWGGATNGAWSCGSVGPPSTRATRTPWRPLPCPPTPA